MSEIRIHLSFRFSFTVGGEGAARLWGVKAGAATAGGLMEGVKENADAPEGVSEGGLEAKEKPEAPEPNAVDPPRLKAEGAEVEHVVGTGKIDDACVDAAICTPAVGPMLNGAKEEDAAGAAGVGAAADARPRLGNDAGTDVMEDELLLGCVVKEPVDREKICFQLTSLNSG